MSTTAEAMALLQGKPLFADFTPEELQQFLELTDRATARAGEVVVKQDDPGDCMYILVRGCARVVHHKDGHYIELATLKGGDFFGEIALVDEGPRSADVRALEDCALVKVTRGMMYALAGVYPTAAFKFLIAIGHIMAERLRRSTLRYMDSLLFPMAGKD